MVLEVMERKTEVEGCRVDWLSYVFESPNHLEYQI